MFKSVLMCFRFLEKFMKNKGKTSNHEREDIFNSLDEAGKDSEYGSRISPKDSLLLPTMKKLANKTSRFSRCGHLHLSEIIGEIGDSGGDLKLGEWSVFNMLGEGTFGQVYKVKRKLKNKHQNAAVKIIKKEEEYRQAGLIEVMILENLQRMDPTGIESLCVTMFDWFDFQGHICIAFQLLPSTLYDFMASNNFEPLPIENTISIMKQVCQAVSFLHKNKIIHTDLKPENIMLVDTSSKKCYNPTLKKHQMKLKHPEIRLIDFGSAACGDEIHTTYAGTKYYRAPEQLLKLAWSNPCDVWSVGCIAFELHTGKALFKTKNSVKHLEMIERILEVKIPENMKKATLYKKSFEKMRPGKCNSPCLKQYFNEENPQEMALYNWTKFLLKINPDVRPTIYQAKRYTYFNKMEEI